MLTQHYSLIDLTHALTAEVPTWGGTQDFEIRVTNTYQEVGYCQQAANIRKIGVGTHIDAPIHFCEGGMTIDELPLEQLMSLTHVIDISQSNNEDYQASVEDILAYEHKYGPIQKNSLVILYSGWEKYWHDPLKYRNLKEDKQLHFPCFSYAAAEYLLSKEINGIGVDTLSPETGSQGFPIHELLLGAGKYILENLANCGQLPPAGAQTIALPPKIKGGTEAPLRVVGLVNK